MSIVPQVTDKILRRYSDDREMQRFLMNLSGVKSDGSNESLYRNIFTNVADIDNPSELNGIDGNFNGSVLIAYQDEFYTLYSFKINPETENKPFTVSGATGSWIAISSNAFEVGRKSVIVETSVDYTVSITDKIILVDASGGDRTITLYPIANIEGQTYEVEKVDSSTNKVIVQGNGGETINGELTFELLKQYESIHPTATGSEYIV